MFWRNKKEVDSVEHIKLSYTLPLNDDFTKRLIEYIYALSPNVTKEVINKGEIVYININVRIDKNKKEN